MKRFIALSLSFFALLAFVPKPFAGPEPLPSGKEMKQVAPAPLPECNWTGFYIGAHVGYGWNDLKWSDTDLDTDGEGPVPSILVEQSADGIIAGGTIGYNFQFGHFVIGAEGEFSYSDVSDSSSNQGTERIPNPEFRNDFQTNSDWVGTFGLRLGFALNKFLFYAKGGGAVTHQEYTFQHHDFVESELPVDRFNADQTWVAPLVGGGIEYMFNCHWSVKAEYTCLFLGKDDINGTTVEEDTGAEPESYEVDLKHQNTVRVGLNYKF